MRIKIGSRSSDLARLQAQTVAGEIKKKYPEIEIEFDFKVSLGDKNLNDPLWKMPEKGVFTEDFVADLLNGNVDLVVHSWKDLPTEPRIRTEIVGTLHREDVRDLFLFRRDRMSQVQSTKTLRVLTSSPRRSYNLRNFFIECFPGALAKVEFESVRGNIPTRMEKLLNQDVDGLIVAKAALDRLLSSTTDEYREVRNRMREVLNQCHFMVLPLSVNPAAAAQGALAIEIRSDREDVREILSSIIQVDVMRQVDAERSILRGYGGGCHQKIGVTRLSRSYGELLFLKGLTDSGEVLNRVELLPETGEAQLNSTSIGESKNLMAVPTHIVAPKKMDDVWPQQIADNLFFTREVCEFDREKLQRAKFIWVARDNAWPVGFVVPAMRSPDGEMGLQATTQPRNLPNDLADQAEMYPVVWASGLKTWQKLAARGVWVSGSSEGLGESEEARLEVLVPDFRNEWLKLSHTDGVERPGFEMLGTYRLQKRPLPKEMLLNLRHCTHFFWMSGSSFLRAIELYPEIRGQWHFCGPGHTAEMIAQHLDNKDRLQIELSYSAWLEKMKACCQ